MAEIIGFASTELRIWDGVSAFTVLGKVENIDWSGRTVPPVRKTNLKSSAEEFLPGVLDEGEMSGDLFYEFADASHDLLETAFETRTPTDFELELTDGTTTDTYAFTGAVISELSAAIPLDDAVKRAFRIKASGKVVKTTV